MTVPLNPDTIARYLIDTPHFFEEYADLLTKIRLSSPLLGRAISLPERQMEILREKIKVQDLRLKEMLHHAQENEGLCHKLQIWTRSLLLAPNDLHLPLMLIQGLQREFDVPQVSLRLWDVATTYTQTWFAAPTSNEVKIFTRGLHQPFCGNNCDFEAASWLDSAVSSIAMLPISKSDSTAFGLLVLGSPDPQRFNATMGTDFLTEIAGTTSAALAYLQDHDV